MGGNGADPGVDEYIAERTKKLIANANQRNAEWWIRLFTSMAPEQQQFIEGQIRENEARMKERTENDIARKIDEFAGNGENIIGFLMRVDRVQWVRFEDESVMELHINGTKLSMPSEVFYSGPGYVAKRVFVATKHAYDTTNITKKHWSAFVNRFMGEKLAGEVNAVSDDDVIREKASHIILGLTRVQKFTEFLHEEAVDRDNRLYVSPAYLQERFERIRIRVGMRRLGEATQAMREEQSVRRKIKTGGSVVFWGFHKQMLEQSNTNQKYFDGEGDTNEQ